MLDKVGATEALLEGVDGIPPFPRYPTPYGEHEHIVKCPGHSTRAFQPVKEVPSGFFDRLLDFLKHREKF